MFFHAFLDNQVNTEFQEFDNNTFICAIQLFSFYKIFSLKYKFNKIVVPAPKIEFQGSNWPPARCQTSAKHQGETCNLPIITESKSYGRFFLSFFFCKQYLPAHFLNFMSKNECVGINTEFWKHFGVFSHNMKF